MLDRHPEVIKQPNETHCMLSKRNYAILTYRMLLTIISPCLTRGDVNPTPLYSRIFTMAKTNGGIGVKLRKRFPTAS